MRPESAAEEFRRKEILAAVLLALAAAAIRAPGLGKWCLTIDEYYFTQSVSFIIERGIPRFPDGGYYIRGIGLQYLTAASVFLFGDREFSARLIPLVFGVLSIPLFFRLCRKFLTFPYAVACAAMLVLSSWHIEFSRFARMYVPFQFAFLLFVFLLHRGCREGRPGALTQGGAVALVAVLMHEGSVFLPFLLMLALLAGGAPGSAGKGTVLLWMFLLLAANYAVHGIKYEILGVVDPLPPGADFAFSGAAASFPVVLPDTRLLGFVRDDPAFLIMFLGLVLFGAWSVFATVRRVPDHLTAAAAAALFVLAALHLYAVAFVAAVVATLRRRDVMGRVLGRGSLLRPYLAASLVFWVLVLWRSGHVEKFKYFLGGYPPLKQAVLLPFAGSVPAWSLVLAAALSVSLIRSLRAGEERRIDFVTGVVLTCLLLVPLFRTPVISTRYCFFFYPLLLIVLFREFEDLGARVRWGRAPGLARAGVAAALLAASVLLATEDYHVRHIVNVNRTDITFRTGKFRRFADHWYPRADVGSPGEYASRHFKDGDRIVIDDPPMSPYLDKPYVNYIDITHARIPYESRKAGTEEMWTGRPLIVTTDALAGMVPRDPTRSLWLIAVFGDFIDTSFAEERTPAGLGERYGLDVTLRYVGIDGRIGVWELRRKREGETPAPYGQRLSAGIGGAEAGGR